MTERDPAETLAPKLTATSDGPPPMPELPPLLTLTTDQQFRAIADPVRSRILGIIQTRPATAKQIAQRLGKAPGTIAHHLEVLEAAGLAQVVATRVVHGITAKYYTRTARIFDFHFSPDVTGHSSMSSDIARSAMLELSESLAAYPEGEDDVQQTSFPHIRVAPERAREYRDRLDALFDELVAEPIDPNGQVYGVSLAIFLAPPYLQDAPADDEA